MFLTCDISSCSTQSCTLSFSCKINHSHETSLPGQVKVQKVHLSNMMGNMEGFYMILKGWQVGKSFLHTNPKRLCMLERGVFQ